MKASRILLASFVWVVFLSTAEGHEFKSGALTIDHPASRATPPGARTGVGFVSIRNDGPDPDRLMGGSAEVAGRFEIHTSSVEDGIVRMRRVDDGVVIEPGETVSLKSGGTHAMLLDLKGPLTQGQSFTGSLDFERAGAVAVRFSVEALGVSTSPPASHEGHAP